MESLRILPVEPHGHYESTALDVARQFFSSPSDIHQCYYAILKFWRGLSSPEQQIANAVTRIADRFDSDSKEFNEMVAKGKNLSA
jgi:hypothetical protein